MNDLDITDQRETNLPPDRRPTNIGWKVFWRRAFAFLIDGLLMSIFTVLALIATGVIHKIMGSDLTGFLQSQNELMPEEQVALMQKKINELAFQDKLILTYCPLILSWLYFSFLESSESQATLGKRLMNLKVTDLDGRPINLVRASARHLVKMSYSLVYSFLPFLPLLFIGYLIALFNTRHQTLHDIIGRCLVKFDSEETQSLK